MHRGDAASTVQVKAIFILLLLGGHEAVRVGEQASLVERAAAIYGDDPAGWATKYREANKACKWSTKSWKCVGADGGCILRSLRLDRPRPFNDQCRLSDDYLMKHDPQTNFKMMAGLLRDKAEKYKESCLGSYAWANPKCKRRLQMMTDALRFMSKARAKKQFFSSMSDEDWKEQSRVYEETLDDLKGVLGEEGATAMRLKDKIQASPALKKDAEGTVKKMMSLLTRLTMGSPEDKTAAKEEIEQMPDSTAPLTADEEKDCKAHAEELTAALEEQDVDKEMDSVELVPADEVEDEEEAGSSALELRKAEDLTRGQTATVFVIIILLIVAIGAWEVLVLALTFYIFLSLVGCVGYAGYIAGTGNANESAQEPSNGPVVKRSGGGVVKGVGRVALGFGKCLVKVLSYPIRAVGAFVKAIFSNNTNSSGRPAPIMGFGGPR